LRFLAQLAALGAGWLLGRWVGAFLISSAELYPHPFGPTSSVLLAGFLAYALGPLLAFTLLFLLPPTRPRFSFMSVPRPALVLLALLAGAYAVTYVAGAPLVRADLGAGASSHPPGFVPALQTRLILPVAPCLLVAYHEYQVAPLAGAGGWYLYLWRGSNVVFLGRSLTWIS
jgi:hypothetical protein